MTQPTTDLRVRKYDSQGRPQMAEGLPASRQSTKTSQAELFVVHHYEPPAVSDAIGIVRPDGSSIEVPLARIKEMPQRTVRAVLECAGNGREKLAPRAPGSQFGLGMCGQADWTGTSLGNVLREFGCENGWENVVVGAEDNGVTAPEDVHAHFAKGLAPGKAFDADTLLAWSLNGEDLDYLHGGPLRLVVPGWYGIWWVKWVSKIELASEVFSGFWQNERYTYQDATGEVREVVREQLPRAVITVPSDGGVLAAGVVIEGKAWAGDDEVSAVQISWNDGESWHDARIAARSGKWGWVSWAAELPVDLPRGMRRVQSRVMTRSGYVQPPIAGFNRLGYGNNGIDTVNVDLVAELPPAP